MRPPAASIALVGAALLLAAAGRPTMDGVLASATEADWRRPDPARLVYLQLESGRVAFELAPAFAPAHVDNLRRLAAGRYFDGLAVLRSQENYVAQWGDPAADSPDARSFGAARAVVQAEFDRPADGLAFVPVDSRDAYADEVGFVDGFPAARDTARDTAWLLHCPGMLGVGRDLSPDSGNASQLYVVTGHAPRHLDRNVTLIGRVVDGIEHLTTLPRGTGPLGFYETAAARAPVVSLRFGDDLPEADRLAIEILRTDTPTFAALVEARRYRAEDWFVEPTGRIDICNVPVPTRAH